MSTYPDVDRSIAAWLELEAPDRAPARLLEASREQIRNTRQRRAPWPARRVPNMSLYAKLAIGVAAVAVLAVVGLNVLVPNRGGIGGPGISPSPSATASPSPSQAAASACRKPLPVLTGMLENCTYTNANFEVPFAMQVNDRWVLLGGPTSNLVQFDLALPNEPANATQLVVAISVLDQVYDHPCHGPAQTPGPSHPYTGGASGAQGFWTWLSSTVPMLTYETPTATTIGGVPALQATNTTKVGQIGAACNGSYGVELGDLGSGQEVADGENAGAERLTALVVNGKTMLIDVSVFSASGPSDATDAAFLPTLTAAADQALSTLNFGN
jgi:hypothetical protein